MKAYRCDRCQKFAEGEGRSSMSVNAPWMPTRHSRVVQVDISLHRWSHGPANSERLEPTLCSRCFSDVVLEGLNKEFGTRLLANLRLRSDGEPVKPNQGAIPCPVCLSYTCIKGQDNPNCPPKEESPSS